MTRCRLPSETSAWKMNDDLFFDFLAGRIDPQEYLDRVRSQPKPWTTSKWTQIRERILKDECEQCGSREVLTLSHDWHPENFLDTCCRIMAGEDDAYEIKFHAYLLSFYHPEGFRRPDLKTFRPEPTKTDLYILGLDFRRIHYLPRIDTDVKRKAIINQYLQSQRYWSMADTRTLCRKCAFALDKKKRKIK